MSEYPTPPRARDEAHLWEMVEGYNEALDLARKKWPRAKGQGCSYPEALILNCLITCRDQNFVSKEEYSDLLGIHLSTLYSWNRKYQVFGLRGYKKRSRKALAVPYKFGKKVDIQTLSAAPPEVAKDITLQIEEESDAVERLRNRVTLTRLRLQRVELEEELKGLQNSNVECPF